MTRDGKFKPGYDRRNERRERREKLEKDMGGGLEKNILK